MTFFNQFAFVFLLASILEGNKKKVFIGNFK